MIKSGSTAWQIIKPGVQLGLIDSIIITYKTLPGYGSRVLLQKRYPDDTRVNGDELLLPLSQADTTLLREEGGDRVRLELQYNYSSGAVAKSEVQTVHIGDTLATAFVDGSNPDEAQIEGHPIEFTAGDAIVIESKNKCVKDWDENNPESEKYIEGRTHYKVCVFHSEMNKPNTHDGWHQIDKPGEGVSLLIDGTDVPDYWWPRYTELSNVIAEAHGTFEAEIKLGFPEDSAYADRTMEYKIGPGNLKNAKYLTMLDDKNYTVNFIGTNTPYRLQIAIIVDTATLVEENKAVYPVRGIYFVCEGADALPSGSHITMVRTGIFRYYPLDPKYIPNEIARTADVVSRQQLAADAGKALVIGEDGVVKAGEVGGGGSLIVTITENDDGTYTPSHTSQEIYEAYMGGKSVTAVLDSYIFYLAGSLEDTALFEVTAVGEHNNVSQGRIIVAGNKTAFEDRHILPMTPATADEDGLPGLVPAPAAGQQDMVLHGDGTWRAVEGGGGSGGGGDGDSGVLYVTLTQDPAIPIFYTPSHTCAEILEAHESGKYVFTTIEETDNDGRSASVVLSLSMCNEEAAMFEAKSVMDSNTVSVIVAGDMAICSYSSTVMSGAKAEQNGHQGDVPAPAAGQQDMVLHGDGTWRDPNGYDVFYRYTAEEDLTEGFEITAIDGETIAYKEIFVRLRLANKTDAKVTPYVKILTDWSGNQDFHPRWNWSSVDPNSEIVICAEAKLLGNGVGYCDWHWYTHAQVLYQNGGNYRRVQNPSGKLNANQESMFDFIKYNVIKGIWCNTTLSAGTDIEIWGKKL